MLITKEVSAVVKSKLEMSGTIRKGHFLLRSGKHSDTYIDKMRIFGMPDTVEHYCELLSWALSPVDPSNKHIAIIGPDIGGGIIAYNLARFFDCTLVIYDKDKGIRNWNRDIKTVLVVDDILTTGGTIEKVIETVLVYDVSIMGIGVWIDRSLEGYKNKYPFKYLLRYPIQDYWSSECPLCAKEIGIEMLGGYHLLRSKNESKASNIY